MNSSYFFNIENYLVFIVGLIVTGFFCYFYKKTKSRPLLNSLPGIFTSLGLLGTFCAIVSSLGGIHPSLEASQQIGKTVGEVSANTGKNIDIIVIISELIPAFTSSITGLVLALLSTIVTKGFYAFEDKKTDNEVKNTSPEVLLFNMANSLADISGQLKNEHELNIGYNDRLNSSMAEQSDILKNFIEGFVNRMDDIFTQMHSAVKDQIHEFGEEQFTKSCGVLESISEQLSKVSSGLLEEQKKTVQNMILGTNDKLESVSNSVTTLMDRMCSNTTEALSNLRSNQSEELATIIGRYDELSTKLSEQNSIFAEKITSQMNDEYEKVQNQSVESLKQMVELKDAYKEVNGSMLESTTEMNKEVSSELRNSLSDFVSDLNNTVSSEVSVLSNAIDSNVQKLEMSYAYISDHVANIKGNYESSAQAFEDAMEHAHRINESQDKLLLTFDKSMESVVQTNEKVGSIINILDNRQDSIKNLIVHINEIGATIEMLQNLESQLNRIAR